MAQVLGVSGLTFRQALGRLRMRRLVSTRPGRGGGTVVSSRPEVLEDVARNVLADTSTSEIADLGTAYSSLFSEVVRLAALRHDNFDDERLRDALEQFERAQSPVQRRRAATLFVVTVGSVARSETLMEFLVPVVGDLQSILWLDGSEPFAQQLLDDVAGILGAIGESDPEAADRLAREHAGRLTSHLVVTRTRGYVQEQRTEAGLNGLLHRLDDIRVALQGIDEELHKLSPPRPVRSGSAERIDELLRETVDRNADLVRGAGIAYAPGLLRDAPLWMDWWDTNEADQMAFKSHAFSNASLRYYDYTHMPWFTEPLRADVFAAQGPYLDRGGIERVTITVSLPVKAPAFQGSVLGADLRFGSIAEILFGGNDVDDDLEDVLVDEHGRVVVSAVPGLVPGDLIPFPRAADVAHLDVENWPGLASLGWRLVRLT